jgi:hypothetical protein
VRALQQGPVQLLDSLRRQDKVRADKIGRRRRHKGFVPELKADRQTGCRRRSSRSPPCCRPLKPTPIIREPLVVGQALPAILAFVCSGMLRVNRSFQMLAEWGRAHQEWCSRTFGFKRCTLTS